MCALEIVLSEPFWVSNGVRLGSVLSPFLCVYLDGLLVELSLVLVVTGEAVLLVLLVMQMIWCYWLHVHQL